MADPSRIRLPRAAFRREWLVVVTAGVAFAVPVFLLLLRYESSRGLLTFRRGVILAGICLLFGLLAGKLWSYLFLRFFVRRTGNDSE